jgi:hypothetical protein
MTNIAGSGPKFHGSATLQETVRLPPSELKDKNQLLRDQFDLWKQLPISERAALLTSEDFDLDQLLGAVDRQAAEQLTGEQELVGEPVSVTWQARGGGSRHPSPPNPRERSKQEIEEEDLKFGKFLFIYFTLFIKSHKKTLVTVPKVCACS